MKILYIVRGIPGSGKSTLAKKLVKESCICEADQFFMKNGKYEFDGKLISAAHDFCSKKCEILMNSGEETICVSNTFTKKWEMEKYFNMAKQYDYHVTEIICRGNFKNVHDVPVDVVTKMQQRFEF